VGRLYAEQHDALARVGVLRSRGHPTVRLRKCARPIVTHDDPRIWVPELASCPVQDLRLRVNVHYPRASDGIVSPGFSLKHFRGLPCAVTGSLQLAIENPDGSLIDASDNPVIIEIHRTAAPGESLGNGFSWRSWCGPRGKYLLVGRFATLSATRSLDPPRDCLKNDADARLDPFGDGVGGQVKPGVYRAALRGS
jgi:hypothetical protein